MVWKHGTPDEATLANITQEIFSVLLIDEKGGMTIVGSCFIISKIGKHALCLSARHVFEEIYSVIRKGNSRTYDFPSLEVNHSFDLTPWLDKRRVKVLATIDCKPYLCDIVSLSCLPPLDTALIVVEEPPVSRVRFGGVAAINSDPLPVNTEVILVSYRIQKVSHIPNDGYAVDREVAIRVGKILSLENTGSPLVRAPVYLTNIPCDPGMSGGPVYLYDAEMKGPKQVCGVISSDMSAADSFHNCYIDGHSYVSLIWPCGALNVRSSNNELLTLIKLVGMKYVVDYGSSINRIDLQTFPDGQWKMMLKPMV